MDTNTISRAMIALPTAKRHTSPLRSPSQSAGYVYHTPIAVNLNAMMDLYEAAVMPTRSVYSKAVGNTIHPIYMRLSGGILNAARTRTR